MGIVRYINPPSHHRHILYCQGKFNISCSFQILQYPFDIIPIIFVVALNVFITAFFVFDDKRSPKEVVIPVEFNPTVLGPTPVISLRLTLYTADIAHYASSSPMQFFVNQGQCPLCLKEYHDVSPNTLQGFKLPPVIFLFISKFKI